MERKDFFDKTGKRKKMRQLKTEAKSATKTV